MIKIADNPVVREQLANAPAATGEAARPAPEPIEYARAPDGPGFQPTGRPAATQRNPR